MATTAFTDAPPPPADIDDTANILSLTGRGTTEVSSGIVNGACLKSERPGNGWRHISFIFAFKGPNDTDGVTGTEVGFNLTLIPNRSTTCRVTCIRALSASKHRSRKRSTVSFIGYYTRHRPNRQIRTCLDDLKIFSAGTGRSLAPWPICLAVRTTFLTWASAPAIHQAREFNSGQGADDYTSDSDSAFAGRRYPILSTFTQPSVCMVTVGPQQCVRRMVLRRRTYRPPAPRPTRRLLVKDTVCGRWAQRRGRNC